MDKLSIDEIKMGYRFDTDKNSYICNSCEETFEIGEIYCFDHRFFEAPRAIQRHIQSEHGDRFKQLLYTKSKYNAFTDNQKELLSLMYSGLSDKEIAKKLDISSSTVRHQRFTFREKAKKAKMYLAIYQQAIEKQQSEEDRIIPVHNNATMVDDRYVITEKEKNEIVQTVFESLSPLQLKTFPKKEKKKVVILSTIARQLKHGKRYTEKELNQILKEIYHDYVMIRRYLVDYGFVERTMDGQQYWLN